jgi:hypothetical protein
MSQLLLYQRVRRCANLSWSDLGVLLVAFALVALTSVVISAIGVSGFLSLLSLSAVFGGLALYTGNAESFIPRLCEKKNLAAKRTHE